MLKYRKAKNNNNNTLSEQQKEETLSHPSLHHPNSVPSTIQVCINSDMLENAVKEHRLRLNKRIDPSLIRWKSFSASSSSRDINNNSSSMSHINNDNNNDNNDSNSHIKNTSLNSTTKHDNVSIIK